MPARRYRDFDAFEAEQQGEPIVFQLGGWEWAAPHANDASAYLAFAKSQGEGGAAVLVGFEQYLTSMLAEEDRDKFTAMLNEQHIKQTTLVELVTWVFQQATGVPFVEDSPSQEQPSETGAPSRVVSIFAEPQSESSASAAS